MWSYFTFVIHQNKKLVEANFTAGVLEAEVLKGLEYIRVGLDAWAVNGNLKCWDFCIKFTVFCKGKVYFISSILLMR